MGTDKAYEDSLLVISDLDDQPLFIASNVENHPVTRNKTGSGIPSFDIRRRMPDSLIVMRTATITIARRFTRLLVPKE